MQLARCNFMSRLTAILGIAALFSSTLIGQTASQTPPDAPKPQARQFDLTDYSKPYKHFPNPVGPYLPHAVPAPSLSNTPRLSELMRDGKIVLSLDDAIALALENNLDLAIARYNLNIADVDILRAKAGSSIRGVNTGVVQGTPGGGVGGIGGTSSGAGAGGTTSGAGGAGAGSSGIVTSTSGVGSVVPSYDPVLTGTLQFDHNTFQSVSTFANAITKQNSTAANFGYQQGFMSGTNLNVAFNNNRATTSSIFQTTNPSLSSSLRATVTQHLLQGFGFLPNTRFIRIAKNNRHISDVAFRLQVITTVNQIQNIYWDLVNAYENVKVQDESLKLAQKTLSDNKKQVEIGTLAPIEVVRAQSVVATNEQSLIVAKTNLELQQLLMKNALSRTLVDPALAEAEVIPSSTMALPQQEPVVPIQDLVNQALNNRAELTESRIDLTNRQITNKSARNALLPTLDAFVYYQGSGVGGALKPGTVPCPPVNPPVGCTNVPPAFQGGGPVSYSSTLDQIVNSTAPDKGMGLTLTIPIRNRSAQADQIQAQLEYRQAEMRLQQLENQVRIEVRNAQFTVQQNRAAVESAQAAAALAHESLDAEQKKYALGASTTTLVLQAQRDMAQAQSNQVTAMSNYQKSRVELDRVTGSTLDHNGILMDDAVRGQVSKAPHVPYATPRTDAQANTTQPQQ
jgi:outer membrane protein TolC